MSETRREMLADLADAINELVEPRQHSEMLEATVIVAEHVTRSGKTRAKRTLERRRHTITLPCLIQSLRDAAVPGAGDSGAASGGFESRPSAELEPLSVLREITDDTGVWSRTFSIERPTLERTLSALVSAHSDDAQLRKMTRQAQRWVRRARLATGFDRAPITLGAPCPYCQAKNQITVTGDMEWGRCARCGTEWTPDTIGLLAEMLTANVEHETLALAPCWQDDCTRYGDHPTHQDSRGRTWGDTCELSGPDGRLAS